MTDLAKLVVKLEAESAKLHRDLDKANKKLLTFGGIAKKAGRALRGLATIGGAALGALGVAMGVMLKKTLALADRIGKLSQTTGLSVEHLSRLRFQAELTGTNFEELTKGVVKFQRSMYDAQQGLATQRDAFEDLGITLTDNQGNLRETEAVMGDMADAFSKMEDGAKKSALAQVLIGRAGSKMIPFLNEGREGLKAMADEADALGITLDGKLTAAAEATNDNLSRLKAGLEGVFLRVMAKALPKLEEFTKQLVAWVKNSDNVAKAMEKINIFMKTMATIGAVISGVLKLIGEAFGAMAAAASFALGGEFKKAMQVWEDGTINSIETVFGTVDKLAEIWEDEAVKVEAQAEKTGAQLASPAVVAEKIIGLSVNEVKAKLKTLEKVMADAVKKSADMSKEFQERFTNVTSSDANIADANTIDVGLLELQAQKSLRAGDIDGALSKVRKAFDILDAMKEAGTESGMVLEGLAMSLQRVGEEIAAENLAVAEAKIEIDKAAMMDQIGEINEAMQAVLDANPLTQTISINKDLVPNAATQKADAGKNLQPVNMKFPGFGEMNVYGDKANVEVWSRDLAKEATKRGTR